MMKEAGAAAEIPEPPDPYETVMFAAEIGSAPELDLHKAEPHEVLLMVDQFINHEFLEGSEAVRIIHGRGSGKLRGMIHNFLKNHDLVAAFRDSHNPSQIGGVTVVALYSKDRDR